MTENDLPPISRLIRSWTLLPLKDGGELEVMRFGSHSDQPLVMLNSVEYSSMPPWQFCLDAKSNGYQVIFIRRPGFGRSSPCRDYMDQQAIVSEALEALNLNDILLHATGTAGYLGWHLLQAEPRISSASLNNFSFGPVTNHELERVNSSVRQTVKQAISSDLGCRLLLTGLKALRKSGGTEAYVKRFFGKSEADLAFIKKHPTEVFESFETLTNITAKTLRNDIKQVFAEVKAYEGHRISRKPFQLLIGGEACQHFRDIALSRAEKLGGTVVQADAHDYFVGLVDYFEKTPANITVNS